MANKKEIPLVKAKLSALHIPPVILAISICPHCHEANFVQIRIDDEGKDILHTCIKCEEDYVFEIPSDEPVKSELCPE